MQIVEKPDTVIFVSKYGSLRYPVFEGDKKQTLQWKDGTLSLYESQDGEIIKELRRLIDDQWLKKDGEKVKNEKGNYVLVKPELPFKEYDTFTAQVESKVLVPTEEEGKFVEMSPQEVKEKLDKLKDLEELFEDKNKISENQNKEEDEKN